MDDSSLSQYVANHAGIPLAAARVGSKGVEREFFNCDPETRFEIGSITKVFTGILLCEAVANGLCDFDTRLAEVLPKHAPKLLGQRITLKQLATHTASLPRLPMSHYLHRVGPQPYDGWDPERLLEALSRTIVHRLPGTLYHYSNFGFAVLGLALEKLHARTYRDLVEDLTRRLGCPDVRLPTDQDAGIQAIGHNLKGEEVETWRMRAFASAGGLTSTLDGLVAFAQKCLAPLDQQGVADSMVVRTRAPQIVQNAQTALLTSGSAILGGLMVAEAPASLFLPLVAVCGSTYVGGGLNGLIVTGVWGFASSDQHAPVYVIGARLGAGLLATGVGQGLRMNRASQEMGIGWQILKSKAGQEIIWHNGGMAGVRTILSLIPAEGKASIILAASAQSVDSIGRSLVTG